ncbi:MAG TPA: AAA family ATPase [Candidatus Nanoarchaeia archaeon]|nr:AAA family ATPase [Candidatus Nanoarchaeia archaeon]
MDKTKYIIWLTGASGVGKTTLLSDLKEKHSNKSNWEFVKFDSIGVPSTEDMIKKYGSGENWQRSKTYEWIGKMVNGYPGKEVIIMDGQANLKFIKKGFKKQNFKNYQIVLIDCEQDIMIKRLIDERQQAGLASEEMKNWLKLLRHQAQNFSAPIIETSHISPSQVVEKFENILKNNQV